MQNILLFLYLADRIIAIIVINYVEYFLNHQFNKSKVNKQAFT